MMQQHCHPHNGSWRLTHRQNRCTRALSRNRRRPGLERLESRALLTGVTAEYSLVPAEGSASAPFAIVAGPDGNLWFADPGANEVGKITTSGQASAFGQSNGLTANSQPSAITVGPDGNIWFTESGNGASAPSAIGMISPSDPTHTIHQFTTGLTPNSGPEGITAGPDGNLWFVEAAASKIGKITTAGVITEYGTANGLAANSRPWAITKGPDGNLWFTQQVAGPNSGIGMITTAGAISDFGTSQGLPPTSVPYAITAGPGGKIWFTDFGRNKNGQIGTVDPASHVITELPTALQGNPVFQVPGITAGPDGNLWFTVLGSPNTNPQGFDQIATFNPQTNTFATYNTTAGAVPMAITSGPDGNVWFTEFDLPYQNKFAGAIGVVTLDTHLVTTTPSGVSTGVPFGVTATVQYDTGAVDVAFAGGINVSISHNSGGSVLGGSTVLVPSRGVATFNNLTLNNPGNGYILQIAAAGATPATTSPFDVTGSPSPPPSPTSTAPTITGERIVLTFTRHNKRGRPVGKPIVSFVFQFSTAMNQATVDSSSNYQVAWESTKRLKKKKVVVFHPIGVQSAVYNSSSNSVTVTTTATAQTFGAVGGQLIVTASSPGGVSSAPGVLLAAPTTFTISRKATAITPAS
jgi:streptogramin lyase